MQKSRKILAVLAVSLTPVVFLAFPSVAHEKQHHKVDKGMPDHMKEMYALKDKIPEEYRIMERTPIVPDEESLQQGQNSLNRAAQFVTGNPGTAKALLRQQCRLPRQISSIKSIAPYTAR